jgi:hypothetical protein
VVAERQHNDGGEILITWVLESGRKLESDGERCGGGRGWCSPFIGAGGASGRGGIGRLNGFNTIDRQEGLRGGLIKGFKAGEGKCLTIITRHEVGAAGMARGGNVAGSATGREGEGADRWSLWVSERGERR